MPTPSTPNRCRRSARRWRRTPALAAILLLAVSVPALRAEAALASVAAANSAGASAAGSSGGGSLEAAASRAGDTGRKVAMSLIGLGFAIAAIVLSFRRDFKEAAGVFAVGIVAVLLATPAGVRLLRDTVASLFGAQ